MQRLVIVFVLLTVLVVPVQVHAAGKKTVGAILTISGGAMMLSAFNYEGDQCPSGYSINTFENIPTQCVFISLDPPFNSDTRDATTRITYERPGLMWSGLGVATMGIVLMLLPTRTAEGIDVSVTPTGWLASKTFGF